MEQAPKPVSTWKSALARKLRNLGSLVTTGQPRPMPRGWFTRHEIARLHAAGQPTAEAVDDQTWRDLDLDAYIDLAAGDCSVFGRQWLCARLRGCDLTERSGPHQVPQLKALVDDAGLARAWMAATADLRCAETEVAGMLFAPDPVVLPHWVAWLWLVPLGFGGALALFAAGLHGPGGGLALAALGVSAAVQIRLYGPSAAWQKQKRSIRQLLAGAMRMAALDPPRPRGRPAGVTDEDRPHAPPLPDPGPLWAVFGPTWLERMAGLAEYADLVLLSQYRRLAADLRRLGRHRQALQDLFLALSQREANAWLACHLRDSEAFCWNQARAGFAGAWLAAMRNPLLARSKPVTLALGDRGLFLTGKNGSGKSTLLRSLGMNAVLARALGVCMADAASLPLARVATSIRIEDSLLLGRSLYVAELLRAAEMLAGAGRAKACLVIFDEIFRGTNHMESVSAAAAVIRRLALQATVVVSSHHVDLARWVEQATRPLVLGESPSGLRLEPGLLAQTNGIDLLLQHGFDAEIHATALGLHQELAQRALGRPGPDQAPPG